MIIQFKIGDFDPTNPMTAGHLELINVYPRDRLDAIRASGLGAKEHRFFALEFDSSGLTDRQYSDVAQYLTAADDERRFEMVPTTEFFNELVEYDESLLTVEKKENIKRSVFEADGKKFLTVRYSKPGPDIPEEVIDATHRKNKYAIDLSRLAAHQPSTISTINAVADSTAAQRDLLAEFKVLKGGGKPTLDGALTVANAEIKARLKSVRQIAGGVAELKKLIKHIRLNEYAEKDVNFPV